jgi:hypothetical protein
MTSKKQPVKTPGATPPAAAASAATAYPALSASTASRATVRMYRQGLGDCLYVELPRHGQDPFRIMIDAGLVLGAKDQVPKMRGVLEDIVTTLGGKPLDLLVVTHPHWDHVSGFIQAPEIFAKIATHAVWFAWTEDPHDALARKLSSVLTNAETALRAGVAHLQRANLDASASQTDSLLGFLGDPPTGRTTRDAMKAAAAKVSDPHYCLPGEPPFEIAGTSARIFVLGPPRDEAELRKMNPSTRDPETYSLTALTGLLGLGAALTHDGATDDAGKPFDDNVAIPLDQAEKLDFFRENYFAKARDWQRIDHDWLQDTTGFALLLDRAVNNSSLALAIELEPGGDVLLFAADAQVGNWLSWLKLSWQLGHRKVTGPDLIARTIAYKVGHHASLNASLRKDGVETMGRLRYSLVPVDAQQAIQRKWGNNIPFGDLLDALNRKGAAQVLRSDQEWAGTDTAVNSTALFHEVTV